jgi:hypothetical protein
MQQSGQHPASREQSAPPKKHKPGPVDISINWRARVEGWDWFGATSGNSNYALGHSLLRIGLGQQLPLFNWQLEVAQATILGLPDNAVDPAPQGQLGLGGTYYAANGNHSNNAYAFVKQAFIQFNAKGEGSPKLGRFEFFDGTEVKPKDPALATLVLSRLAHRLISNFGFSAVQRTFDGAQLSWNSGENNLTFLPHAQPAASSRLTAMASWTLMSITERTIGRSQRVTPQASCASLAWATWITAQPCSRPTIARRQHVRRTTAKLKLRLSAPIMLTSSTPPPRERLIFWAGARFRRVRGGRSRRGQVHL